MPKLPPKPMQRTAFISYSREDSELVRTACRLLNAAGVQTFIDVLDIEFGEPWEEILQETIERAERVLVFWSNASSKSEWVEREWRAAMRLGKRVVPILMDATPLPTELSRLHASQDLLLLLNLAQRREDEARADLHNYNLSISHLREEPKETRFKVELDFLKREIQEKLQSLLKNPVDTDASSSIPTILRNLFEDQLNEWLEKEVTRDRKHLAEKIERFIQYRIGAFGSQLEEYEYHHSVHTHRLVERAVSEIEEHVKMRSHEALRDLALIFAQMVFGDKNV